MLPTYLNRRKLSLAEAVPLLDSVQAETLVPGRASAFILKDADAVLIAPTLQEAEAAFNDKRHHLVIVQHSEPANSHPVVNFSNLGVPCLFASDGSATESLLQQVSADTPLVVCMQTSSIHLWDSQKAEPNDYISSGFAVHPAKIAISLPATTLKRRQTTTPELPQEIKDLLISIRDAQSKDEIAGHLDQLEQQSWVVEADAVAIQVARNGTKRLLNPSSILFRPLLKKQELPVKNNRMMSASSFCSIAKL